jgi:hypothetical protein
MSRSSFWVLAVTIVGVVALLSSVAGAETELPIDGSNFTVRCSGGVLATNKPWGKYPTTITGCVLASDMPFSVGGLGITCKGGNMVEFYAGTSKVKYCTLALDAARVINTAGAQQSCKAGNVIQITQDSKVNGCAPQTGGPGPGKPPTGTTGGGTGGTTGGGTGGTTGGPTGGGGQPPITTQGGGRIVVRYDFRSRTVHVLQAVLAPPRRPRRLRVSRRWARHGDLHGQRSRGSVRSLDSLRR